MIFPWVNFLTLQKMPMTWFLISLSLVMQVVLGDVIGTANKSLESLTRNKTYLQVSGRLFVESLSFEERQTMRNLVLESASANPSARELLGIIAHRSIAAENLPESSQIDPVLKDWYQHHRKEMQQVLANHPYSELGFSSENRSWNKYFTYQFIHGSWSHFFVNMLMLLIFGSYLEPIIGAMAVLVIYLFGGALGAMAFQWVSPASTLPMVGASASVMAVLGALVIAGRQVKFMWIFPGGALSGIVLLPVVIPVVYFMSMDIAGLVSHIPWMGSGVAHSAHLGGLSSGALLMFLGRTGSQWQHSKIE